MRYVSAFPFWLLVFVLQLSRMYRVIFEDQDEDITSWTYIREVLIVSLLVIPTILDLHLSKYISWEAERRQGESKQAEKYKLDFLIRQDMEANEQE